MWKTMPEASASEDIAAKAFRMISRLGALLQELVIEPQRQYPCRVFLALEGDEQAEAVSDDPTFDARFRRSFSNMPTCAPNWGCRNW